MLKVFIDSLHKWLKRKDLKKEQEGEKWVEVKDEEMHTFVPKAKAKSRKKYQKTKGAFGCSR